MNSRVEELYKFIQAANKELESIQSSCEHKHETEKLYSWRAGCMDYHMVCDECNHVGKYVRAWSPPQNHFYAIQNEPVQVEPIKNK